MGQYFRIERRDDILNDAFTIINLTKLYIQGRVYPTRSKRENGSGVQTPKVPTGR